MKLEKQKGKLITKHLKGKKGIKEIFNIPLNCHSHDESGWKSESALTRFSKYSPCE